MSHLSKPSCLHVLLEVSTFTELAHCQLRHHLPQDTLVAVSVQKVA